MPCRYNLRPLGRILFALSAIMICLGAQAQTKPAAPAGRKAETPEQLAARTKWWREAKFGMFIHWGLYAVPADSTKGLGEWYMNNNRMQVADYMKFAPQFDPEKFDAKKWVQVAKDAGMKYLVITSKHHDGFDMFDARNSDYTITRATPFKRDPMKELAAECKKQGLKFCFYHSIMDWHHPDYLPRREWEKDTRPADGAQFPRYIAYLKEQLRELVTTYDPSVLWFDGEWENTWTHEMGRDLYDYVRSLKPSILVNNRVDKGRSGMAGMTVSQEFAGDFGTPEQEVPPQGYADNRLWETCMTLNDTWGYARNDHNWKSSEQLIHTLIDVAHKGGNLLLNVGPTDLGEFTPETIDRLETMGKWMKANGASIYGTTKSPFKKLPFNGRCTRKGNTLYLHVFQWPESDLRLPLLKNPAHSVCVLGSKEGLSLATEMTGGGYIHTIGKPKTLDPYATVIELRFNALPEAVETVALTHPNPDGVFILSASDAEVQGGTARTETKNGVENIGYWMDPKDTVSWTLDVPKAGRYSLAVNYACPKEDAGSVYRILVESSRETVEGTVGETGGWADFTSAPLSGVLNLPAGRQTIRVIPQSMPHSAVMNLRSILLTPAP